MKEWRVINTGYADGFVNMATDEGILLAHACKIVPATIRFYGWRPAAVSVGYFQELWRGVNVGRCKELGIDIVRRPTGGRAILHDKEVTYSLVVRSEIVGEGLGVMGYYDFFAKGIIKGLQLLGVRVDFSASKRMRKEGFNPVCFMAGSRSDIMVGDKKIVGSAQLQRGGVVLQHGSILVEVDRDRLLEIFHVEGGSNLGGKVTCLKEVLNRTPGFEEIVEACVAGFEEAFQIKLVPGQLAGEEKGYIEELLVSKYRTYNWNCIRGSKRV